MTDPEMTEHAATFDRAAPTYDRVGVEFFSTFGRMLVDAAEVGPGERVLDVGTGRGAVLGPAATAVGPTGHAVGVDLAPTMVALTSADLDAVPQATVRRGDATALPTDLGTFDAVLSSMVLFFTDDPAATVAHWAEHVAPGGRLGLVTFLADDDDDRFRDLTRRWMRDAADTPTPSGIDGEPTPFELVRDPSWLDQALANAGFTNVHATVVRHATRFDDAEHWWDWAWSNGMRATLERLDPSARQGFRDAIVSELDAQRLPDGGMGLHVSIRITIARR
ncbi:MAG TPA: methyltransferase domain-containing protein [Nitriliruptoraceae bacterium]|nr:methyltransferase domain-containing protein [Nitriliruptoraceae bacterium]